MNDEIKKILDSSEELKREYTENVFFRVAIESVISDSSAKNIINIIHLLSTEAKYQLNKKRDIII